MPKKKSWRNGGITSFSDTCFASYWEELPNLVENDKAAVTLVDPYNFRHRMTLGKFIIENTGSPLIWGDNFSAHWYWGYLAQLDWQWTSGRLIQDKIQVQQNQSQSQSISYNETGTSMSTSECRKNEAISINSWFGYMNVNFSVAVYCGAAKAGLVPEIQLLTVRQEGQEFDLQKDAGFLECVDQWESFWTHSHKKFMKDCLKRGGDSSTSTDTCIDIDDCMWISLYDDIWRVHTQIIKISVPNAKHLEKFMAETERKFALGWCHMVELLAAMSWTLLSLDSLMEHGVGHLPTLKLDDKSYNWMKDNRHEEYDTVNNIIQLYDSSPRQIEFMCAFWRRLVYFTHERKQMPTTMKILSNRTSSLFQKMLVTIKIVILVSLPHSLAEWILWIGLLSAVDLRCFND